MNVLTEDITHTGLPANQEISSLAVERALSRIPWVRRLKQVTVASRRSKKRLAPERCLT